MLATAADMRVGARNIRIDPKKLPKKKCDRKDKKGTVQGHQEEWGNDQTRLRNLKKAWDDAGCFGPLPATVLYWLKAGLPQPRSGGGGDDSNDPNKPVAE
jgi:hypothetical protein